jgi:hypothetical protein
MNSNSCHVPGKTKKWTHNFCKKSIEGSIVRKQLIVKLDAPTRQQFLALIGDRLNTQITDRWDHAP